MKKIHLKILILAILGVLGLLCAITGGILLGFNKIGNFDPGALGIVSIVIGIVAVLGDIFLGLFWEVD